MSLEKRTGRRPPRARGALPPAHSPARPGPGVPPAPLPLRHPAAILAALVAAAAIATSVSFRIVDTDLWQHLLVGRAIWQLHQVPRHHLWTYPSYGQAEVLPSWGFRALIWPFWRLGQVPGLFLWRWLTTLATFSLLWAAGRRLGARGLTALVVLVLCSLVYRQRSQVRPETLASVLLALEIWILEVRRHARGHPAPPGESAASGPARLPADPSPWLVALLWVWVNVHISYFLGFVLIAVHLVDDLLAGRRSRGPDGAGAAASIRAPRRLALVALAALAVAFLNPFGWRALWQPFDYLLHLRREAMFRGIGELQPVSWPAGRTDGTFVLLFGWPLLLLWRARRFGLDRVEAALCALMTAYAVTTQRFLGTYAVVCAPYAARDLDAWVRGHRWPAWTARAWVRAALAALAAVAIGIPEWSRPDRPLAIALDWRRFPVRACDFIAAHELRGRAFNSFHFGGYLLWRFWPDPGRRPFMDIHQTGSAEDRRLYVAAFSRRGWAEMTRRRTFDYVLLDRYQYAGDSLSDVLDADSSWSLVFLDDAAALYLRRAGPLRAVADSFAYRVIGAGTQRMLALAAAWTADSALRARARAELERQAAGSPYDATAERGLGMVALAERRLEDARRHLQRALEADPGTPRAHEALGIVALWAGQSALALLEFERERVASGPYPGLELRMGLACQMAGDLDGARRHFASESRRYPGNAEARAMMETLERQR